MVLPLKRWKSRASPGIEAGAQEQKTHHNVQNNRPRVNPRAVFWPLWPASLEKDAHYWRGMEQPATGSPTSDPAKQIAPGCKPSSPIGGAGWSSPVARQAHNLKVAGSNPAPATITPIYIPTIRLKRGSCSHGMGRCIVRSEGTHQSSLDSVVQAAAILIVGQETDTRRHGDFAIRVHDQSARVLLCGNRPCSFL